MQLAVTLIAILATVLGSWMALPQAIRLVRTRCVDGVSASWIGVSVAINVWWLAYGVGADVWVLLPVATISVAIYGTMAAVFLRTVGPRGMPGMVLGMFGLGMVPLPFLVLGGWTLAGVALGLAYGIQLLPAVLAACTTDRLSGVAPATWLTAWAEAALWLAYVALVPDVALALAGVMGVVMATVILVRLSVTGHRPFARGELAIS